MVKNQCFEGQSSVKFVLMLSGKTLTKPRSFAFFASLTVLLFTSCKSGNFFGKDHGTIVYEITYPYDQNDIKTILYPSEMEVIFDENYERSHLSTAFSAVENDYIIDHKNNILTQIVSYLGNTYELDINSSNHAAWLEQFPKMTIEYTDDTMTIAGYECKKALAHFPGDSLKSVDLFYTDDIEIGNGNWWNIYHEIDGVLLGYDLVQYGKRMQFRAKKVEFKDIQPDEFNFDKGEHNFDVSQMKDMLDEIAGTYL